MAIRVTHAPSAGLAGLASLLGGLGQQRQKQMEQAEERDRFLRQLGEQQRQFNIEQAMRQQQMAVEAELQKAKLRFAGRELAQQRYLQEQEMDLRAALQQRQMAQQAAMQGQRLQAGLLEQQMGQQGQMARQQMAMAGEQAGLAARMQAGREQAQLEAQQRAQQMLQEQQFEQTMLHERQRNDMMLKEWDIIQKAGATFTPEQWAQANSYLENKYGNRARLSGIQAPENPIIAHNRRVAEDLEQRTGMMLPRNPETGGIDARNLGLEERQRYIPLPNGKTIAEIEHGYDLEKIQAGADVKPQPTTEPTEWDVHQAKVKFYQSLIGKKVGVKPGAQSYLPSEDVLMNEQEAWEVATRRFGETRWDPQAAPPPTAPAPQEQIDYQQLREQMTPGGSAAAASVAAVEVNTNDPGFMALPAITAPKPAAQLSAEDQVLGTPEVRVILEFYRQQLEGNPLQGPLIGQLKRNLAQYPFARDQQAVQNLPPGTEYFVGPDMRVHKVTP